MLTQLSRPARAARHAALVLMLIGAALAAGSVAGAQPAPASPTKPAAQQKLKRTIESRYRPLAIQGGILLVPRQPQAGVESIEVLEGTIGINGRIVTGAELRDRLGSGADVVIELTYLEPAARQALLFGPPPEAPPPPPPQIAPEGSPEEPQRIDVRRRSSDARVRIGGSVTIDKDEVVSGSVVVVLGSATVHGEVRDEVVVVLGDVRLGPDANVLGDVTVVGGRLDVDPQARIRGQINEIGFDVPRIRFRPFTNWGFGGVPFRSWWFSPSFDLFAVSLRMLLFGLLAVVAVFVAGQPIDRIERRVAAEPWKSGLVGLLAQLLFVPLLVLTVVILAVSIIGIPLLLLVPFALLALLCGLLIGFAGVACRVGRLMQERFGLAPQNRYLVLLIGLVAIWALSLVGHFVALGGWAVWAVAAALGVIGFLV
ncbi:MAG: hypothetical protein IMZ67_10100, partial [Acidobacteria bacterium]|nr:hypothetical protein [Acidobacteriota bacterium]